MKKFFAVLFVLALSVLGTLGAEQKFFIPIGENFKYHPKTIQITIWMPFKYLPVVWAENTDIYREVPYDPSQGTVQEAAEKLLRQLAAQFSLPRLENTNDMFSVQVDIFADPAVSEVADNGPFFGEEFTLMPDAAGRWRIPDSRLKLELRYPLSISYYLPWVKKVETVLHFKDGKKWHDSTEQSEGTTLFADISAYRRGVVSLATYLIVPGKRLSDNYGLSRIEGTAEKWLAELMDWIAGWTRGELTLFGENNTFITVDLQNGVKIAESTPPPYPVGPRAPRIALIARRGSNETELFLEGEKGAQLILEFSENLATPSWENIEYPYVLLTSNARIITHYTGTAKTGFYRMRPHENAPQKR